MKLSDAQFKWFLFVPGIWARNAYDIDILCYIDDNLTKLQNAAVFSIIKVSF